MRSDATVIDDMASGESDTSWNGYWEAQARRTPYTWSAEMRIPFFTLGFQSRAHRVVMGIGVYRWMARTGSRHVWPPVRLRWARGYAKPSRLADVSLERVRSRRAIYVTPYALAGVRVDRDGPASTTTRVVEAGADLRTNLLSNLTLDLTVNTDFAQVEADDARINLTRFPLFFPEKRQFFLDRADIFAFSWERDSRLFHSRRVGLRDGQPLRIHGGTRLAGRAGDWDLGLLDMKTAAPDGAGFGENLSVLRLRRRLPQGGSPFGAMLTSRLTEGQGHSLIAGVDADIAVVGDEFLTLTAAWSASSGVPPEATSPVERAASQTGPRGLVRWQRRSALGLSYDVELAGLGSRYRSDLGFEERADVSFAAGRASYLWLQGKGAFFSQLWAEARAHGYRRNADGRIDSSLIEGSFNAETPEGHYVSLLTSRTTEDVAEAFDVARSSVTRGQYAMDRVSVTASGADSLRWRPSLTVTLGDSYGGTLLGAMGALIINPNAHFELGLDAELYDVHLPVPQHRTTSLVRARLQLALDTHASLMTLAQYNQADGTLVVSARARYNLREGSDDWLVYDERQTEERGFGSARQARREPSCSRSTTRSCRETWSLLCNGVAINIEIAMWMP